MLVERRENIKWLKVLRMWAPCGQLQIAFNFKVLVEHMA